MDKSVINSEKLVHLARLGLAGRRQDVDLLIRRIISTCPELSESARKNLSALIMPGLGSDTSSRAATVSAIPVDNDSRIPLLRSEHVRDFIHSPVWSSAVASGLSQIISERQIERELMNEGLHPTRSALFTGSPGVGKTLAARWLANQLGLPLLTLDLSSVISSFLGKTGTNVRNVLDYAKSIPSVLLLDEFDSIAKRRDDSVELGELKRLVTVLLQEIDDWPPSHLLLAATNHPALLDPAVWRRFETVLEFPLPEESLQKQFVSNVMQGSSIPPRWVEMISKLFAGKSFSDLERFVVSIKRQAVVEKRSIEDVAVLKIAELSSLLEKKDRIRFARELVSLGYSQREVSVWTGTSRDTIRKATNERNL